MPSHVDFIFDRFLMAFCFQLRPLEPQESSPRCSESTIYQKIAFRNLYRFFFDFGANMPPFSFQKSVKIGSKLELGRHRFFDRFLHWFFIDFPSIWDANFELCWPLWLLQDASKTAPKTKCATFFAPGRFLVDYCSMFDRFWVDLWLIFHRLLVDLGLMFERFCFIIFCSSAVADTQLCCALDTINNSPPL